MLGYTGDDLTVVATLAAFAAAMVWDAVKERGWRRWAAATIAVVSALSALFWATIKHSVPEFASHVTAATVSFQTWFLIFLILAAAFLLSGPLVRPSRKEEPIDGETEQFFRQRMDARLAGIKKNMEDIWERINSSSKQEAASSAIEKPKELVWVKPREAVRLIDEGLDQAMAESLRNVRLAEAEAQKLGLFPLFPRTTSSDSQEALDASAKWKATQDAQQHARNVQNSVCTSALVSMRNALEKGVLIAQGYREGSNPLDPPVAIPKEQWRFLEFSSYSMEEASGREIEYTALRFAQPD